MLAAVAVAVSLSAQALVAPAGVVSVRNNGPQVSMNAAANENVKFNKKSGNAGLYGWQVKKNSKTGDTANLRGYTVGSRAPPMAIKSGTTIAQTGFKYKTNYGKARYTTPGLGGDTGLDLRAFEGSSATKGSLFVHRSNMLTDGGAEKDCFINRAKAGPIAATNDLFVHSGVWHSAGDKDTFLSRVLP